MKKNKKLKIAIFDISGIKNKDITNKMVEEDFLYNCIKDNYSVSVDQQNPDLVISYLFGRSYMNYDCLKMVMTNESRVGNPDYADLALTCNEFPNHTNHFKICLLPSAEEMQTIRDNKYYTKQKTKFCAFMYSNQKAKARKVFCIKLMDYKKVDCLGSVLNNTKLDKTEARYVSDRDDKAMNIYKDYKFVIAFENSSSLGYLSERILLSLSAGSIPIYWGAPDVKDYINPECFINVNDFDSFEDCIEYVKKVDNDDELYQKYINAKPILPNSKLYQMSNDEIGKFLKSRLDILLENPNIRVGKIGILGRIRYRLWFKWSMRLRRERQRWLYNVKMPIWEKIKWVIKKA